MGTTPVSECKRRSRNEVPWPARKGATPDLILEATGLAVDATITAPYVVRCANWVLSFCTGREVKDSLILVMSSNLCKYGEGAVFPFQVESVEDGVEDAVHTFNVHKTNHGTGSAPHFDKAALDDIRGPQFPA